MQQVAKVTEILVQYQNLRQLDLSIDGAYDSNMDYFWILDIAMASQHLQKLSVTVSYSILLFFVSLFQKCYNLFYLKLLFSK
jgi:hypothetical protein